VPVDAAGIAEVVLGGGGRAPRWHLPSAVIAALLIHAGLWWWAWHGQHPPPAAAVSASARVPIELSLEPPRAPAAAEAPRVETPAPAPPRRPTPQRQPPPPARAAAVVAREPDPGAPVDLTAETFVTGTSNAYAGGVTAAGGTSDVAVQTGDVRAPPAPGAQAGGPDLSRAVSLEHQSWSCAWPSEADAERITEQTVVIRVLVDAQGTAESAEVVSDPGHGFGQAASACALRTRFNAARDPRGAPVRARSPLIRVRFTR
jgi:periplasmic protein TonB